MTKVRKETVLNILAVVSAVASLVCFSGPGVNTMDQDAVIGCLFGGLFYLGLAGFLLMEANIVKLNKRISQIEGMKQ